MQQLGFPADAVQVVRSIYRGATTSVLTPFGPTDPIACARGVLQGDTLSPFLFLVMLELLLRWLEAPGSQRGYRLRSVDALKRGAIVPTHHRFAAADVYADDSAILTGSATDMQIQMDKVALFSAWSGILLNSTKCDLSAAL